jgi:signal peptidase I
MNDYTEQKNEEKIEEKNTNSSAKEILLKSFGDLIETVLIASFTVLVIFSFILCPVSISGSSMNNTFNDNDRVCMVSLFYTPKCGDIVIVDQKDAYLLDENNEVYTSEGLNKKIIKRVIATGGQTLDIDFETGTVTLDGEVLQEDYINGSTILDEHGFEFPITIPEGYVFVMGDNREHSTDSRSDKVGLIPVENVVGHVVCRFYPFSQFKVTA